MRIVLLALVVCGSLAASTVRAEEATLEIRFCPAGQVRSFPLESRRSVQSLLLQNVLVLNRSDAPIEIVDVTIELLQDGSPIDSRRIAGADLARAGATGVALQKSGMVRLAAFQFCGSALIDDGTVLAGPTLGPAQALLVAQQPFAYRGKRDVLRLRVHARGDHGEFDVAATLPVQSGVAGTSFQFPLRGTWFAGVGPTMHTGHRWALPEEFGYDIVRLGDGGLSHRGQGNRFADYYAYGAPVYAAAGGVVALAVDGEPENPALLRRAGETDAAYAERVQAGQGELLSRGARAVAGNCVVIDHGGGEYSLYAHLRPGSVRVRLGERVEGGALLGKLGSSGNSTEPHLHFQVCDGADPLACAGIPVQFRDVELPYADFPRLVQSGDVVIAR